MSVGNLQYITVKQIRKKYITFIITAGLSKKGKKHTNILHTVGARTNRKAQMMATISRQFMQQQHKHTGNKGK